MDGEADVVEETAGMRHFAVVVGVTGADAVAQVVPHAGPAVALAAEMHPVHLRVHHESPGLELRVVADGKLLPLGICFALLPAQPRILQQVACVGLDLETLLDGLDVAQIIVEEGVVQRMVPVDGACREPPARCETPVQGNDRVHGGDAVVLAEGNIEERADVHHHVGLDGVAEKRFGLVADEREAVGDGVDVGVFQVVDEGLVFHHQPQGRIGARRMRRTQKSSHPGCQKQPQRPSAAAAFRVVRVRGQGVSANGYWDRRGALTGAKKIARYHTIKPAGLGPERWRPAGRRDSRSSPAGRVGVPNHGSFCN